MTSDFSTPSGNVTAIVRDVSNDVVGNSLLALEERLLLAIHSQELIATPQDLIMSMPLVNGRFYGPTSRRGCWHMAHGIFRYQRQSYYEF